MTTKKKTQKGSRGKGAREELKARAAEIVADVRTFDADTRRAVYVALANLNFAETDPQPPTKYTDAGFCERELRAAIEKVEKGVPMFDAERFKAEAVAQAFALYDILEPRDADVGLPDFIVNAARVALDAAAERYGVNLWLDVDGSGDTGMGGHSVAAIAGLFERAGTHGVEVEPVRDLAGLVSAVLKHPDTPRDLYDGMRRAIATMTEPDEVNEHPDVLRAALAVAKAEEGGE